MPLLLLNNLHIYIEPYHANHIPLGYRISETQDIGSPFNRPGTRRLPYYSEPFVCFNYGVQGA